jgi:hypothetical protein
MARAEEGLARKRRAAEIALEMKAHEMPPTLVCSQHRDALATLRELRAMGAVEVSVSDTLISARFEGPPVVEVSADEKPQRNHLSLSETERDELARLREQVQMNEELGVD